MKKVIMFPVFDTPLYWVSGSPRHNNLVVTEDREKAASVDFSHRPFPVTWHKRCMEAIHDLKFEVR